MAGLPAKCWPKAHLVNRLATEAARLRKNGVSKPFVYTDVKQWVPEYAVDSRTEEDERPEEVAKEVRQLAEARVKPHPRPSCFVGMRRQAIVPKGKEKKHLLSMAAWSAAWSRLCYQISANRVHEHLVSGSRLATPSRA